MNGFKCMLPESFNPGKHDFVIGRGKQVKQHLGNQSLYDSIRSIADDYTSADKARKSFLLSHLVAGVYVKSPNAGFVKKDPTSGRWYAVEDALARSSAAQAVRDCLHNHYKSSRQFKQQRRRQAKQVKQEPPTMALPVFARQVTPCDSFYKTNSSAPGGDLFSLLSAFAPSAGQSEDPFMPVPLPHQSSASALTQPRDLSAILASVLEDDNLISFPTSADATTSSFQPTFSPLNLNLIPEEEWDNIFA